VQFARYCARTSGCTPRVTITFAVPLLILLFCSFDPGFFCLRRVRWTPLEKFCASVGLSFILVWLANWILFLLGANNAVGCGAITVCCVILAALSFRDALRVLRSPRVLQAAAGFTFLLTFTLVALAAIRNYSGAGWAGDWLEQFSRSLFYLHHFPKDTQMFGGYSMPSRPPGLNIIAAYIMAQTGDRFENFQITYTFLNLLLFLPCCLMLPFFGRARRWAIVVLAALFTCSPFIFVNATYTGAKGLAAFYIVLGAAFYLKGWRKQDRLRTVAAFLFLAAGLIAHYSAGPYCVFFAGHYLISVFPKRTDRWKELASIAAAAGILLAAWFGWTIATYGLQGTVKAPIDTSVTYGPQYEGSVAQKYLANLFDSVVPHVFRGAELMHNYDQPNAAGYLRDQAFVIYESNLVFAMGIIGGPLAWWFLIRALRNPRTPRRQFWIALVAFSIIVGLLVVGERDYYGIGHLTLMAMFALGLVLLANRFGSSRIAAMLIVAGCAIDFGLGVYLQARVEHLENTPSHPIFGTLSLAGGNLDFPAPPDTLSQPAWANWFRKHQFGLSQKWIREMDAFRPGDPAVEPAKAAIRPTLDNAIRDGDKVWHGWYAAHNGEVEFLGDRFGDTQVPATLLVLLGGFALWLAARQIPRPAPVAKASPVKPPARKKR
jgi:hypothetical protein